MFLMYTLASLPFAYVFSFIPKSTVMGFSNFFILNAVICVIDSILNSFTVFIENDTPSAGPTRTYRVVTAIATILAVLLPADNLKHALSNIQLHENTECISASNALIGTKFSANESLMAVGKPGVGGQFIIFLVQIIVWWIVLIVIENYGRIQQARQRCCGNKDLSDSTPTDQWNDSVRSSVVFVIKSRLTPNGEGSNSMRYKRLFVSQMTIEDFTQTKSFVR